MRPRTTRARPRDWLSIAAVAAVFGCVISWTNSAFADTRQACSDAYDKVQDLRDAGKLEEAIQQADICSRDTCSKAERDDCTKWDADLVARESSVVLEIVDTSGAPVTSGTVSLDGARWLDHVDAAPHVIPQGSHTLEVLVPRASPGRVTIAIQEGEKNRKVTISITTASLPVEEPIPPLHRYGPWILGGAGVAALVAGAATGGVVVRAYDTMKAQCNDGTTSKNIGGQPVAPRHCTQAGVDAENQGRALGPATTVLLAAGGALVAGGVIWLVAGPHKTKRPETSFAVAPAISNDRKGVVLGGAW